MQNRFQPIASIRCVFRGLSLGRKVEGIAAADFEYPRGLQNDRCTIRGLLICKLICKAGVQCQECREKERGLIAVPERGCVFLNAGVKTQAETGSDYEVASPLQLIGVQEASVQVGGEKDGPGEKIIN